MTLIQGTQTRPATPTVQLSGSREQAGAFDSVLRDVAAESETRRDTATANSAQGPSAGVRDLPGRQEQNPESQHALTAGEAIVGLVPVPADAADTPPTQVLALPPALTDTGIADPEPADPGQPDAVSTDHASTAPVITDPEIAQFPLEAGSEPVPGTTVPVGVPTPSAHSPAHSPAPAPPATPARGDEAKGAPVASSLVQQAGTVSASEPGGLAPSTAQVNEEPAPSGTEASVGQREEKPTAATPVSSSAAARPADGSSASTLTVPAERVSAAVSSSVVDPIVDPARTVATPPAAAPALTTPAAPASVAVPPTPPAAQAQPLSTQLAQPLFSLVGAKPGEHLMTIQVTPDNLGPVTIRAVISGDDIRIEMFSPSDSGREALRQILTDLRRDLAGGGLSASLDLSSKERFDEGTEHRPAETPSRRPAPAQATPAGHEQRPAASGPLASSTLDITI